MEQLYDNVEKRRLEVDEMKTSWKFVDGTQALAESDSHDDCEKVESAGDECSEGSNDAKLCCEIGRCAETDCKAERLHTPPKHAEPAWTPPAYNLEEPVVGVPAPPPLPPPPRPVPKASDFDWNTHPKLPKQKTGQESACCVVM